MESKELYNPRHHGFREERGAHTALALIYEQISVTNANRDQSNVIMRDVSKAFDKVWIRGLIHKINRQLNVPISFMHLLGDFLRDRTAYITINNHKGPSFQLKSGVPQGSYLSLYTVFCLYN